LVGVETAAEEIPETVELFDVTASLAVTFLFTPPTRNRQYTFACGLKFTFEGPTVVVVQSPLLLAPLGQDTVVVSVPLGRFTETAS